MESSRKYRLYENLLYLILWVILFITPIAGFFFRSTNDVHFVFHWSDVFHICYEFIPFLVLFLIHNFIIAPLLIDKNKRVTYLVLVIALLACFATYQLTYGVQFKPDGPMPGMNESFTTDLTYTFDGEKGTLTGVDEETGKPETIPFTYNKKDNTIKISQTVVEEDGEPFTIEMVFNEVK
jgi:hypothetical protein